MADIDITETQFKLPDGLSVYQKTWAVSSESPLALFLV